MSTTRQKIAVARFKARRALPYFGSAISALVLKEVPGYGTFGVTEDGIMIVDPEVVEEWSHDLIAGVIVHECMHVLRRHAARCRTIAADPKLWNVAADCEIDDDILATQLPLPQGALVPASIGCEPNLPAEVYYRKLCEQKAKDQKPEDQSGEGSGKNEEGSGETASGNEPKADKGPGSKVTAGECGGCAGNPGEGEKEAAGKTEGRTPRELDSVRRQTAEAIRQAAANGRGSVPGGLQRWAEEMLAAPTIPWQQKLAKAVRASLGYRAGAVDYTYRRVSRRQSGIGFGCGVPVIPALHAPQPTVTVVLDTSASMSQADVTNAMAEVRGILLAVGGRITFVACDAKVHALKPIARWQDAKDLVIGDGGTDFRPAFDAISSAREKPNLVVFFTDGDGPAPESAPTGYKVVWGLIGNRCRRPADWGEAIEISKAAA